MLVSSVALVRLSVAAKVGLGEGLLSGHVEWRVLDAFGGVDELERGCRRVVDRLEG